jgi:hypothetical protein
MLDRIRFGALEASPDRGQPDPIHPKRRELCSRRRKPWGLCQTQDRTCPDRSMVWTADETKWRNERNLGRHQRLPSYP